MKFTATELRAMLSALTAASAPFDPAAVFVGVGSALTDNGQNTALADITACTGAMATRQAVTTWSAPFQTLDGMWYVESPLLTFAPTSGDDPQTVAVWFAASLVTAGVLKSYARVNPSLSIVNQYQSFNIVVRFVVDPGGTWSLEVIFDG